MPFEVDGVVSVRVGRVCMQCWFSFYGEKQIVVGCFVL